MGWQLRANAPGQCGEVVRWDDSRYEWRTIEGEECLCPIREKPVYFEFDGTWKKEGGVSWDATVYEIRNVDGERHVCPIKKPRVVGSDIWSGRRFTGRHRGTVVKVQVDRDWRWVPLYDIGRGELEHLPGDLLYRNRRALAARLQESGFKEWL